MAELPYLSLLIFTDIRSGIFLVFSAQVCEGRDLVSTVPVAWGGVNRQGRSTPAVGRVWVVGP
jgi:hypothetical protein